MHIHTHMALFVMFVLLAQYIGVFGLFKIMNLAVLVIHTQLNYLYEI